MNLTKLAKDNCKKFNSKIKNKDIYIEPNDNRFLNDLSYIIFNDSSKIIKKIKVRELSFNLDDLNFFTKAISFSDIIYNFNFKLRLDCLSKDNNILEMPFAKEFYINIFLSYNITSENNYNLLNISLGSIELEDTTLEKFDINHFDFSPEAIMKTKFIRKHNGLNKYFDKDKINEALNLDIKNMFLINNDSKQEKESLILLGKYKKLLNDLDI